eukprot:EC689120.1.p1 GENE.EC689120.1~~EC689120.1.p1  ORF type:complete len:114 (-),score=21.32 EC689120.1:142-459(-)
MAAVNVRGLVINMQKIFSGHSRGVSRLIVLLIAQVMGMYFLSSVLLMRMNLPEPYREIVPPVLGDIPFQFYPRWFDVIFLMSALFSLLVLWIVNKSSQRAQLWDE